MKVSFESLDVGKKLFMCVMYLTDCGSFTTHKSISYSKNTGCSRLHARIAFDSTGTPWLRDLGSGNGTTINKKNLPPQSIGKLEANTPATMKKPGSRGVIVYPGDVIQFGASTRIYVLNGPCYFDRGAMKARKQMMLLQKHNASSSSVAAAAASACGDTMNANAKRESNSDNNQGVSWGMDFDVYHDDGQQQPEQPEQEESSSQQKYLSEPSSNDVMINLDDPSTIPDKHRKLYDKLMTKKYKLQNIQTEMRRIQTKSVTVELSSGQQAQLERNEKQEQTLEEEIKKIYSELQMKLSRSGKNVVDGSHTSSIGSTKRDSNKDDEDDVDDFYDRTSKRSNTTSDNASTSETMESLTSKWKFLVSKLESLQHFIANAKEKVNEIEEEIKANKATGGVDDDCFFLQNDLEIANDQYEKIHKDQEKIQSDLDSTEKMVLIIDDKIVFDREMEFIGRQSELDTMRERKERDNEAKKEMSIMPPPPLPPKRKFESSVEGTNNDRMPPPPPIMIKSKSTNSKQVRGPMMPPPPPQPLNSCIEPKEETNLTKPPTTSKTKRKRQGPMRPPVIGTLQALQQASSSSCNSKNDSEMIQNDHDKKIKRASVTSTVDKKDELNPKVDQWVAPKGQDGSGRTKLNAKFQGRY